MKIKLLLLLLLLAFSSAAQDTVRTRYGYNIDYPFLYVKFDTIHNMTQVVSYYNHKVLMSINDGPEFTASPKTPRTVWSNHFTVVVSRKKYRHIYTF